MQTVPKKLLTTIATSRLWDNSGDLFLVKCSNFFLKINEFQQINLVSNLETLVWTSYYLWLLIFANHVLKCMRSEECSLKVFDKVWHEGIFLTLKQNGINGNLLPGTFDLNGQISNWADVNWADEFPKDSF